jgi:ribosomal protein S18 acetylase RimI-like enzyme
VSKSFTDRLYEDYWKDARAYGMFDQARLIALIELTLETWNNRLRVTNLWVDSAFRRRGCAKRSWTLQRIKQEHWAACAHP